MNWSREILDCRRYLGKSLDAFSGSFSFEGETVPPLAVFPLPACQFLCKALSVAKILVVVELLLIRLMAALILAIAFRTCR